MPFAPARVLLCHYEQTRVRGVVTITLSKRIVIRVPAAARSWAATFDTAATDWPPGSSSCPADFGVHTDAFFESASGETIEVVASQTGCASVSNGTLTDREVSTGLRRRLDAVFGPPLPA